MLIWTGWGIIAILPMPLMAALYKLVEGTGMEAGLAGALALVIGGAAGAVGLWAFDGWRERRNPPRVLVDPNTGQQIVHKRRDSFFWIPLRYFWMLYAAGSVAGVVGATAVAAGI